MGSHLKHLWNKLTRSYRIYTYRGVFTVVPSGRGYIVENPDGLKMHFMGPYELNLFTNEVHSEVNR